MSKIDDILAEREKTHGDYRNHARVTQRLKAIISEEIAACDADLSYRQAESLEMILHKIGRVIAGDPSHRDHWDDIAGYARIAND